ncbi:Conserved_hypothetical protein [Hexamita inflata]|uniref:Transmembrane protein n=1 Tax=Hexamita inflata TaxID=28002 RepID=A0AA86UG93_9EUKA|nr:Conserved hypothetical protein [Hexamita inflata]CAI9949977.1 Conserved hypothetical protein [Hexamita inflata]
MKTTPQCLVTDGYKCLYKTDVDLYRAAKEKIYSSQNSDIQYLCSYTYLSKFKLYSDTDEFLDYLSSVQEFGNITQFKSDFNIFKNAVINNNYTIIGKMQLKYFSVIPSKQKQMLLQDSCVVVIQDSKFLPSSQFSSLRDLQTASPTLLFVFNQMFKEILHFARYVDKLSYILDNNLIKGIYLGHNWISGVDYDYADILEQQQFVENQIGTNQDLKIINKVCLEIAQLYRTRYFVYSTNQKYNTVVKTEQLQSNIDGTNQKFRLSFFDGFTFLTKPLISKNKSILGIPQIGGYLTLQMNINDIFSEHLGFKSKYIIMDATGYVVYSQDSLQYSFGIKQLLIQYGYLQEVFNNATIQSAYKSCSRNTEFWATAYQRSLNNEFLLIINSNTTSINPIITNISYNKSAVYERSVIFNATSEFFKSGYIIVKEFSVFNEFIVVIEDVQETNITQEIWENEQQNILEQYLRNIPQNITALNIMYSNLTIRNSSIPQKIYRITPNVKNFQLNTINGTYIIIIIISQLVFLIFCKLQFKTSKQSNSLELLTETTCTIDIQQIPVIIYNNYFQNTQNICEYNKISTSLLKLKLKNFNYIFSEQNLQVSDREKINHLLTDLPTTLFKQLEIQRIEEICILRSFQIMCTQIVFAHFQMSQRNTLSQMQNSIQTFKSNLEMIQTLPISFIPSKRFITIKEKIVSQSVTKRLLTAKQSRTHSKPISRSDCIEMFDIPFWFEQQLVRENCSPFAKQENTFIQIEEMANTQQLIQDSLFLQ